MRTLYIILGRLLRRLAEAVPVLLGVVVLTFVLMRVLPADPAVFFANSPAAGAEEIAALRQSLGLDKPMLVQLGYYLRDLSTGDLGKSLLTGQPVLHDLMERLPASLELTLVGMSLALLMGIPLGVLASLRPGSVVDHIVRVLCVLGVCVPTFVAGLFLIFMFYVVIPIAPDPTGRFDIFSSVPPHVTGFLSIDFALAGDWEGWKSTVSHLVLPACTMAIFVLAPIARTTRSSMIGVLNSDYIRTARSLGLSWWKVLMYAFRNVLLPVVTITGLVFSSMLGTNVLVEKVFSWPGIGSYSLDALAASDYAPVQGFVLMMAAAFVVVNLLIDAIYSVLDPRVVVN